jgi:Xaa-Pro aminopeptidase
MDQPGAFAHATLQQQQQQRTDAAVDSSSIEDLSCPCCFRPGKLCASFAPEEAPMKIRGLRVLMASHGLDAYIVPSGDAHSSEYVAPCDERRAWLTGFTGSAGTAIVTKEGKAALWTDGRYFNQAATQLDGSPFVLMRQHEPGVPDMPEWCAGLKVGVCGSLAPLQFAENFRDKGVELIPIATDFVDVIWGARRPKVPRNEALEQPLHLTGESVASKLERVRTDLKGHALVLNALDQICWLTNLRGCDVECNPVFFAYAVVADELTLYLRCLNPDAGDEAEQLRRRGALLQHFGREGCAVILRPYALFDAAECARCVVDVETAPSYVRGDDASRAAPGRDPCGVISPGTRLGARTRVSENS